MRIAHAVAELLSFVDSRTRVSVVVAVVAAVAVEYSIATIVSGSY